MCGHRHLRRGRVAVAAVLLLGASGCDAPSSRRAAREVDRALISVDTERMNLRTERVGHDQWESTATFVLVDARNVHDQDLIVTLRGRLTDEAGGAVAPLHSDSLRIPAGGARTFALVAEDNRAHASAVSAAIEIAGAYVPTYPPPVVVTDGVIHRDGDRLVVNAIIRNTRPRPVRVLVIAGFYDDAGVPVRRPFTEMVLAGETSHPAQFVGPGGGVKGYIFVGDMVY